MDMWTQYRDAVREALPQAVVIADKPPVLRMVDSAGKEARKAIRALEQDERGILMFDVKRLEDDFYEMYQAPDRQTAVYLFDVWAASIPKHDAMKEFKKLAQRVNRWHAEAFSYFDNNLTNSFVERMNLTVRRFDLEGFGLDFKSLRGKVLFYIPRSEKIHPQFWNHGRYVY